jgi:hypothetical protein
LFREKRRTNGKKTEKKEETRQMRVQVHAQAQEKKERERPKLVHSLPTGERMKTK